jgi:hypothetical protein
MASHWSRNQKIALAAGVIVPILIWVLTLIFERHSSSNSINNNGSTIGIQQNNYGGTQQIVQPSTAQPTQATQPAPAPEKKTPAKPKSQSQPRTKVESSPNGIVNPQGSVTVNQDGSIVNNAPNLGNQTVNNGPPLPRVTFQTEPLQPGTGVFNLYPSAFISSGSNPEGERRAQLTTNYPGVLVTLSVDAAFTNATFKAQCDNPCESIDAKVLGSDSQAGVGNSNPNVAILRVMSPATLNTGQTVKWEVRSGSSLPIRITSVTATR